MIERTDTDKKNRLTAEMTQTCTRNLTFWADKKEWGRILTYFRSANSYWLLTCRQIAHNAIS